MEAVNYRKASEPESLSNRQMNLFEDKLLSKASVPEHKIIGQVFDTYWLVQYKDNLYIIDQHAAHERVLYEKDACRNENKGIYISEYQPAHYFKSVYAGSTAFKYLYGQV